MQVRPIEPGELEQARALLMANGWAHRVDDAAEFRELVARSQMALVAVEDGKVIGFLRALTDGVSNGYISMVAVDAACRRRGVGTALVRAAMGDDRKMTWVLRAGRKGVKPFYEKLGFRASAVAMERLREGDSLAGRRDAAFDTQRDDGEGDLMRSPPLHIGIVGCSAEGASLCYRTICEEAPRRMGEHAHPEVSMHTHSLADYVRCLDANEMAGVAELMLSSARKLASAGAQVLICPDNTIHQAFDLVAPRSPVPWLHIAEVVAREAKLRGHHKVGLTGTKWLVDSDVYPAKLSALGIECVKPSTADRIEMNRWIMDELVAGKFTPRCVQWFQSTIAALASQGCDAVILGCTEIPLIISDANSPLPTLDSTRLLARAALERSLA